jgi:hypothetical protein
MLTVVAGALEPAAAAPVILAGVAGAGALEPAVVAPVILAGVAGAAGARALEPAAAAAAFVCVLESASGWPSQVCGGGALVAIMRNVGFARS